MSWVKLALKLNLGCMNTRREVLIGPYRSGKSWNLLEKALEHCRSNFARSTRGSDANFRLNDAAKGDIPKPDLQNEALIIVPSQRYRSIIERRLHELLRARSTPERNRQDGNTQVESINPDEPASSSAGLCGLKILTFSQFCQNSLLKAGVFAKVLPDAARSALVASISKLLVDEGKIAKLAPVIGFSGTQAAILALIDQWQVSGYRADQVLKQIKAQEKSGHHLELALIYSHYEWILQENNYIDEHGLMFKLIDLLNQNNQDDWNQSGLSNFIIVDGFDRWHILQLKLLRALSKYVREMYVSFDYEKPGNGLLEEYAWKETSYAQIKEFLGDHFQFAKIDTIHLGHFSAHDLAGGDLANIEVFSAADRSAEAATTAARVKAAIVLNGVKANEIVVTARNLGTYKSAFEAAFQDAELDYHIDEPVQLMTLPIVHFVLDLLSLADNDFNRRPVIDCLRSSYFDLTAFNLTVDDVEKLNAQSLDENVKVVAGREQWQAAINGKRGLDNLDARINKMFDMLSPPDNIDSAWQYATWVEDLLEHAMDLSSIDDHDHSHALSWKQKEAVNEIRRLLAHLIQEEEILRTLGQRQVLRRFDVPDTGASFYYRRLEELIEKANLPARLPDTDKVLITSAELVPNERYKQIYIAGMLEGEFPASQNRSGFITGEELAQWQSFGIPVYDPRLEPGFEYALFASLINRAQEKAVLSYPATDIISSKEEPVPSFFLTSLDLIKENNGLLPLSFDNFSKAANSARNATAYCLWHGVPLAALDSRHHLLLDFVQQLEEKMSFADKRSQKLKQSPLAGYLVDHVAAGTIKVNLPECWSASRLNEYGKCPFSYWLTYVLKVDSYAEPEVGLSAMERGNFYHKAMELFYKEVIVKNLSLTEESDKQLQPVFEKAISDAIIWLEGQPWFRLPEFWDQEKEDLAFRLRNFFVLEHKRFVKEGGRFVPYMVEAEFGPDVSLQPLIIGRDEQSVKLRGRIDRIDIEADSAAGLRSGSGLVSRSAVGSTTGSTTGLGAGAEPHDDFYRSVRLRLVDYKSGSTLPTDADFESGRNIQLPLYALAAQQVILPGSRVAACSYLSIGSGKASTQDGPVLQQYLNVLPEKISQSVERIESGDFSLSPSHPKVCVSCNHRTICRIKEFPRQFEADESAWENGNGDD